MEVVYECCCGLDVHAKMVVACLITRGRKEIRTFATMTDELLQLGDWLSSVGCTHVAIESTGVYWKPVFNILEGLLTRIIHENAGRNGSSLLRSEVIMTFGPRAKERADGRGYCTTSAKLPSDPPDQSRF